MLSISDHLYDGTGLHGRPFNCGRRPPQLRPATGALLLGRSPLHTGPMRIDCTTAHRR